jgi:hypothetical protein
MKKELKLVVKIKDGFVSTNDLYKAKVSYSGGHPHAQVYKNPKANTVERIIKDQLRAVDFTEYLDFLKNTKQFRLLIQFILKKNIKKKDTSNYIKNLEDIWTRFVKDDLGISTYDDSLHVEVHAYKSIIPNAKEEIACIQLSESKFNLRFDKIEKPERVFLGGTCALTDWRKDLIPELEKLGISYFNPVVPDWTPECREIEVQEKEICNTHLYIITPEMKGVFSIAECIDSAYKHLDGGFCFVGILGESEWDPGMKRSLQATIDMINSIGDGKKNIRASWMKSALDILDYIKE